MGWYARTLGSRLIDIACGAGLIARQRAKVLPHATGRVLEVGFGSGLNLPFYRRDAVERVFAVEPDAALRSLAQPRLAASAIEVDLIDGRGEAIPLDDASVDSVVVTFTLCSIGEVEAAAAEMRRVLKPGGRLFFAEHGQAPGAATRFTQRALEPVWRRLAGGCHLTRRPFDVLAKAGFAVDGEEGFLPGAPVTNRLGRFAAYHYWGAAQPR